MLKQQVQGVYNTTQHYNYNILSDLWTVLLHGHGHIQLLASLLFNLQTANAHV